MTFIQSVRRYSTMMNKIKTFVFIDLETTGLPSLENNLTKITELCIVAAESSHLELGVYPRVQNKLTLAFNPRRLISTTSTNITGLDNAMLENQSTFSAQTVHLINRFLDLLQKPICLVAHNGNRFDYPILRTEIEQCSECLPNEVMCIDSLEAFRYLHKQSVGDSVRQVYRPVPPAPDHDYVCRMECEDVPLELRDDFDELLIGAVDDLENRIDKKFMTADMLKVQLKNETTPPRNTKQCLPGAPVKAIARASTSRQLHFRASRSNVSFKLEDVYRRLTNKEPVACHEAEADVKMLMHCAATLGELFTEWANQNLKSFNSIPKMVPSKRIGM